jgi:hypothetical protein
MFLKTLRIFIIVKSGLRRRKFTGRGVFTLSAIFYIFWVVYLAFYTSVIPPKAEASSTIAITGQVLCCLYNTITDMMMMITTVNIVSLSSTDS